MLVGGMVIAAPSMVPEAQAANETLFVSAENSVFDNTFSGPQVVEIVVSDPNIASLDEAHGSPSVSVNGASVLMAQANDGSWYAYVTDETYSGTAQAISWSDNHGLHFGAECTTASAATSISGSTFSGATNVFFPVETQHTGGGGSSGNGSTNGTAATCSLSFNFALGTSASQGVDIQNVVKDAKSLAFNTTAATGPGQIGLADADLFPFIQTYSFAEGGNVVIEYNKAGTNEVVTLKYDATPSYETLDRTNVPDNADIVLEIGDPALNIDPTDEDIWLFNQDGTAFYYKGKVATDPAQTAVPTSTLMFGDGDLKHTAMSNSVTVIDTRLNADITSSVIADANEYVGLIETGVNTSIFTTADAADKSTIFIHADATRGQSGKIDYANTYSIVVTMAFADFSIDSAAVGDEWNSGEALPITLVDDDLNLKSLVDEDLDVNGTTNGTLLIPTLVIGSPLSIGEDGTTGAGSFTTLGLSESSQAGDLDDDTTRGTSGTLTVDSYSKVARASAVIAASQTVGIHTGILASSLSALADQGNSMWLSIDLRSIVGTAAEIDSISINQDNVDHPAYGTSTIATSGSGNGQQIMEFIPNLTNLTAIGSTDEVGVTIVMDGVHAAATSFSGAVAIDFMTFSETTNNSIYRMEMEETGDNTGVFEVQIHGQMLTK
jgi:hypothetical protein